MMNYNDLYTANIDESMKYPKHTKSSSNWTLQDGYKTFEFHTYPQRVLGSGLVAGLNVMLIGNKLDLEYRCRGYSQGFKIAFHSPNEIPRFSKQYYRISFNREVLINLNPQVVVTSNELKSYKPEVRKCYLDGEKTLKYFKSYTKSNCELECLSNFTQLTCGCVKLGMPFDNQTEICSFENMDCASSTELTWMNLKLNCHLSGMSDCDCGCLPSCNSIQYNADVSEGPYSTKEYSKIMNLESSNDKLALQQWDQNWDQREVPTLVKPLGLTPEKENDYNAKLEALKPTAFRHLILIRHGQYYFDGPTEADRSLNDVGKMQAKLTGQRLADLQVPIDNIVISTMTRAQQTGKIIMDCLPKSLDLKIENDPLLEEGIPYPFTPELDHWKLNPSNLFKDPPRIEAAFRAHFHRAKPSQKEDSYTLLVCHANVIRFFVLRALQLPPEAWLRLSLHHASITWLTINPNGRVTLRTLGDAGHMPLGYLTVMNVKRNKTDV
ncbi:unnamed protein product [Diamesa hyperborea]